MWDKQGRFLITRAAATTTRDTTRPSAARARARCATRRTPSEVIIARGLYLLRTAASEVSKSSGSGGDVSVFSYRLPERQGCVRPHANPRRVYILDIGRPPPRTYGRLYVLEGVVASLAFFHIARQAT